MEGTFHYMLMAEQAMVQKHILRTLKDTGLTSILNRMERDGLIERRMLHGNRRSYHIFVTAKGKEKQQRVAEGFAEVETCAFEGVAEAEKEAFLHTFAILYENLQRIGESK